MIVKERPGASGPESGQCADHHTPRFATAQALRCYVEERIARELDRCQRTMSPADWIAHREWTTANVVEAARLWMREKASRGEL